MAIQVQGENSVEIGLLLSFPVPGKGAGHALELPIRASLPSCRKKSTPFVTLFDRCAGPRAHSKRVFRGLWITANVSSSQPRRQSWWWCMCRAGRGKFNFRIRNKLECIAERWAVGTSLACRACTLRTYPSPAQPASSLITLAYQSLSLPSSSRPARRRGTEKGAIYCGSFSPCVNSPSIQAARFLTAPRPSAQPATAVTTAFIRGSGARLGVDRPRLRKRCGRSVLRNSLTASPRPLSPHLRTPPRTLPPSPPSPQPPLRLSAPLS